MKSSTTLDKTRVIDKQTLLKQQIIEYMKKSVLASKIILGEDFDVVLDTPLIFLPHVIRNYRPILSTLASTLAVLTITKYSRLFEWRLSTVAVLPVGFELFTVTKHWWHKYSSFKQIDKFIQVLEQQAGVNRKVMKHLGMRMNTMEELQYKVNEVAYGMIQADDEKFANSICNVLETVCKTLQEQLVMQSAYSEGYYSYIGNWKLEGCPENGKLYEVIAHIEKLSEFYILLSSNLMSSSIFSLEAALWRTEDDFQMVFNTIKHTTAQIKGSIINIEAELNKVFCDFHKVNYVPEAKTTDLSKEQRQNSLNTSIYTETLDDCKNRLRIIFDMTKTIETQNAKTRCIFLEEMLDNFDASSVLVKNLLRYERSLMKPEHSEENSPKTMKVTEKDVKREVVNHREAEIGSDDEEFQYSPHESGDEFQRKCIREDVNNDEFNQNAVQSVAVQNLMLQELRNRMKDVRRIKISRTATGDLIVQERPVTLQESGGQTHPILLEINNKTRDTTEDTTSEDVSPLKFNISRGDGPPGAPAPPPVPPRLPNLKFDVSEEAINHACAIQPPVNKSLLASISSIAKQRSQNEDVFGCDGDDYIASGESSSDDE